MSLTKFIVCVVFATIAAMAANCADKYWCTYFSLMTIVVAIDCHASTTKPG